jgi:Antibiotic biosynthesis monooxygenase
VYARLIEFSSVDDGKREEILQTIQETVLPMLRQYDGFAGYVALYDADKSRAKAIILWETEEAAVSAEETLAERRRQLSGGLGMTIESEDLYEATVVELEGSRV